MGFDNRNFGDCPGKHCCSQPVTTNNLERYDKSCWAAGTDMLSRDQSCRGGLVCANKGYDNRNFGDCPGQHCCSLAVTTNILEQYDKSCWTAGTDMYSRDASCKQGLVCAMKGYDNRNFGDCPGEHSCSQMVTTNNLERYDKSCWAAG